MQLDGLEGFGEARSDSCAGGVHEDRQADVVLIQQAKGVLDKSQARRCSRSIMVRECNSSSREGGDDS